MVNSDSFCSLFMSHQEISPVDAAIEYARQGWAVLPLKGKRPATKHGVHDASVDLNWIAKRFASCPNIGIQTGESSGLLVIDVDPRNGGDETIAGLVEKYGVFPKTLRVNTGGGGYHLYFCHPGGKLRGKLGRGVDVKSNGGCVVAPPSIHPDTKKRYVWQEAQALAVLPDWAVRILREAEPAEEGYSIPEGERNSRIFKLGGELKGTGLGLASLEIRLLEENIRRCVPPLPEDEVIGIAKKVANSKDGRSFKTRWQENVMRDQRLTMYQRGVLQALSLYMDVDGGSCYPSMERLAGELGTTRAALSKAIKKAVAIGWLDRYRKSKAPGEPGKHKWSYGYVARIPVNA